jgi:hypothetical protein
MAGISWREHAGQKILVADYRGLKGDQPIDLLREVSRTVRSEPPGVRLIANFSGVGLGVDYMKVAKQENAQVFGPRGTVAALVGIDGLKAILLKAFNKVSGGTSGIPFSTEAEALEYLTR